jgi:hypothetical protein
MPKGPFDSSQFDPTEWNSASDKAAFGNTLLHFIESDWKRSLFTKSFYQRLSNCFGHIAHYVERVIMRSPGVIRRVGTAFEQLSTLHNCNRS